MVVRTVTVKNQIGLYARPLTIFIQMANQFQSDIWIEKDSRRVNAKSILGVLSHGVVPATEIKIIANGTDEENAVTALVELIENDFDI